jgi:hypothetical protein
MLQQVENIYVSMFQTFKDTTYLTALMIIYVKIIVYLTI